MFGLCMNLGICYIAKDCTNAIMMIIIAGLMNATIVRDHFHLKKTIWKEHLGDQLFYKNMQLLFNVLESTTKKDYDANVEKVYTSLQAYPQHVEYFRSYFDKPQNIAKYCIMKIRGSLCTVTSSAAEQMHSSNESVVPTKIMGIVPPEEQLFEMVKRSDDWIRRDLEEDAELQLEQARLSKNMASGSAEFKALHALTRYWYNEYFVASWNRVQFYKKEKYVFDGTGEVAGHEVTFVGGTGDGSINGPVRIPLGGRCPRDVCICMNIQCVHEMVVDEDFVLEKWGTRCWNDKTYNSRYGNGHHLEAEPYCGAETNESTDILNCVSVDKVECDPTLPPLIRAVDSSQRVPKLGSNSSRAVSSRDKPTYNDLMNEFQLLASSVAKRPELSRLLMGVINEATRIVHDTPACNAKSQMLTMAVTARDAMETVALGDTLSDTTMGILGMNESSDKDMSNVPITATRRGSVGRNDYVRKKPRSETSSNRKKSPPGCGLCGLPGHRVTGRCDKRKEHGALLPRAEADSLVYEITTRSSPRFKNETIPVGAFVYEQVHPDTNFICIHSLATKEIPDKSIQVINREDTSYLCVTLIFELNVVIPSLKRCYVRASKVTQWIVKSDKNKGKVIICKDV